MLPPAAAQPSPDADQTREDGQPVSPEQRAPHETPRPRGPLATRIVTLAGTPDDSGDVDTHLTAIAQLAADTIAAVSYASVTAVRDGATTTVAASSELATAVDQAQYAEDNGPCLDALRGGEPVAVDDISATMTWPGFREAADRMGLKASVSLPLMAGSGATVAALNLYSHDLLAMLSLNAWVWTVYTTDVGAHPEPDAPLADAGGEDLIAGLIEAFEVCAFIQRAIGLVVAEQNCSAEQAYLTLRLRAADTGMSLTDLATTMQPHLPRPGSDTHR